MMARLRQSTHTTTASAHKLAVLSALACTLWSVSAVASMACQLQSLEGSEGTGFKPHPRLVALGQARMDGSPGNHYVNISDCVTYLVHPKSVVTIQFVMTGSTLIENPSFAVKAEPPGASCDAETLGLSSDEQGCKLIQAEKTAKGHPWSTQKIQVDLRDLLAGVNCESGANTEARLYLPVRYVDLQGMQHLHTCTMRFSLRLQRPPAPTLTGLESRDRSLIARWTHGTSTTAAASRVYWSDSPFPDGDVHQAQMHSQLLTATEYQVLPLSNWTTYHVAVTAVDDVSNESDTSNVLSATPQPAETECMRALCPVDAGPTDAGRPQADGGADTSSSSGAAGGSDGCNASSTGSGGAGRVGSLVLAVLAILALLALRRRHDDLTGS